MKTKLTSEQIEQLDNLISETILPALQEDVCLPDMSDMEEDQEDFDNVYEDRSNVLYVEALNYIKNNLSWIKWNLKIFLKTGLDFGTSLMVILPIWPLRSN